MYQCSICHGFNHNARLHCQYCAATPKQYTVAQPQVTYIVAANGVERQESHRTAHVVLRTVESDYYAESE